ncbi:hypothetical protein MRX96_009614 [Rhipicephalus microplus]
MFWSHTGNTEIPAFVVLPVKRCTAVPIPPGPNAACRSMIIFGLSTITNSSDRIRGVCVGFHVTSCRGDSTQAAGVDPVLRACGWAAAVEPRGFILASFSCSWRTII